MKLLILPSHRLMLQSSKNCLTLLPQYLKAEQICLLNTSSLNTSMKSVASKENYNCSLVAMLHYKTIAIYNMNSLVQLAENIKLGKNITKISPIVEESMPKKVAVIDLYQRCSQGKVYSECVVSDKFGDVYRLSLNQPQSPTYLNSNLGIPNFIHQISTPKKHYLLLSDEQNRIKIYNQRNPHQLLSFWFLINQSSIQCEIIYNFKELEYPIIVMLMRYENKANLETNVRLYQFIGSQANMEADQFPGTQVKGYVKFGKQCKFYTMIGCKTHNIQTQQGIGKQIPQLSNSSNNSVLLLFLYNDKIAYELYTITNEPAIGLKSKLVGQIAIQPGNWDYLHAVDTEENDTVVVTYGSDVEMPLEIEVGKDQIKVSGQKSSACLNLDQKQSISLNKYQKIIKIQLKV